MNTLCKKCVLPECKPDITFDDEGICNLCNEHAAHKERHHFVALESEFVRALEKYRGKGKYDCMLMCSGGKDSTLSLYYMVTRYKMRPLVFTFDHGFENDEAMTNIRNAVNLLKVDWLYYKSDFMKDAFRILINENHRATICHICAIWYIQLTYQTASRYDIPLIIGGWTKGQQNDGIDSAKAYGSISKATVEFVTRLRKEPQYRDFPFSMSEALEKFAGKKHIKMLSPHWYLDWNPDEMKAILAEKLGWAAPKLSYPKGSTNCLLNFLSVHTSLKNFGYSHYHIETAKLVRTGELSRDEAIEMLKVDFDEKLVHRVLDELGCKPPVTGGDPG